MPFRPKNSDYFYFEVFVILYSIRQKWYNSIFEPLNFQNHDFVTANNQLGILVSFTLKHRNQLIGIFEYKTI